MPGRKSFNLFIYGTLRHPWVFRAVLGKRLVTDDSSADGDQSLLAREAVLTGYKKISPDNTYLYAVPDPHGRILGYLVGPLPMEALEALRQYEGKNYRRARLRVQTAAESQEAVVFVANLKQLQHSFGYQFHDTFKQEVLLDQKIQAAVLEVEKQQLHTAEETARLAVGELHGPTIRDLVRRHFEAGGISDYAIRHSLLDQPLPDFSRIVRIPEAEAIAPNYLAMVVRQVIFNQLEERIGREFRYELDHMDLAATYYDRTMSSLAALRMLNSVGETVEKLVERCLAELSFADDHLVDYVRWAVAAADTIYDSGTAKQHMTFIANHMARGYVPLGAELEFSNIGHSVIADPQSKALCDPKYDGFIYFRDFGLHMLTWKLGGHIDDHHDKATGRDRRGFFEAALGNVSIDADLSKPITDDPWLLNQFVHETRRFFQIAPHSLHLSLQIRSQHRPARHRLLPIQVFKCLFALAGDPAAGPDGKVRINRLVSDEIIGKDLPCGRDPETRPHMLFSEISRRRSSESDGSIGVVTPEKQGRYIQQFKFLRLSEQINYEPIAMALKGIQISLHPGSFLTAAQYQSNRRHRQVFEELVAWGNSPTALSDGEIGSFLAPVHDGLMKERRGKPAHRRAYIAWSTDLLRTMLKKFNDLLTQQRRAQTT
ncbi:MAG: gamma-glutamylcyclotransferase [Phycisphaerae bacterium]|nr:gamma-glutamylcyclotransferase [Phycisphaerae bacterium]